MNAQPIRNYLKKVLFLFFFLIFPLSCQNSASQQKVESNSKKKANWLYLNFTVEPNNPDIRKTSLRTVPILGEMLYEGLTKLDRFGNLEFAQAKSVDISSDGLHYVFHLADTFWSDGSPVTAQDFVESWRETLNPDFPSVYPYLFYPILNAQQAKEGKCPLHVVGLHAKDEKTFIVQLEKPAAHFLKLTSSVWLAPIRPIPEKNPLFFGEVITNGPFKLEEWNQGHQICMSKNHHYRLAKKIHLDGIHISLIKDENTAAALFLSGDLDMLGLPFSPIPIEMAQKFRSRLINMPVSAVSVCCFNTKCFPFSNEKIRRAFSLAINRREFKESLYPSISSPAASFVPTVLLPRIPADLAQLPEREDEIQQAKQIFQEGLVELGLEASQFPSVELAYHMYKGHSLFQRLAMVIQRDWQEVLGVKVNLMGAEVQRIIQKMVNQEFDAGIVTWSSNYEDPMSFLEKLYSDINPKNYTHWSSKAFQQAIKNADCFLDVKKREKYLTLAEKIIKAETPCAPLFHWNYALLRHPWLQEVYLTSAGYPDLTSIRLFPRNSETFEALPN